VARPPLISRRRALEAALSIIDSEGLEALSMRRLARELNVNGASFYYHFKNKDEILIGAALLALEEVRVPSDRDGDWREWLIDNALTYRQALLAHPALAPVLLKRHPLRIGLAQHDLSAAKLVSQGVPLGAVMPLMDCLESLAIGSVLYGSAVAADEQRGEWEAQFPHLSRAADAAAVSDDELFALSARAIVEATIAYVESNQAEEKKPRRRAGRARAS
jgi:AcrR family transcriptional regulator